MLHPRTIVIGALPVALLGIMYYQHRRLQNAYPTLRVPPSLEISARRDRPAFGMSGLNDASTTSGPGEPWMRTHAGDMWAVTVPQRILSSTAEDASDGPLVVFARAFWSSWPLRIERRIVHPLANAGIIFHTRKGDVGRDGERQFINTARILGGLFVVEAHDNQINGTSGVMHGPLVTSWWLRPVEPKSDKIDLLGGYHSFAVQDVPSSSMLSRNTGANDEPSVRLCFVSHLILSSDPPALDSFSIPSADLRGLSVRQRIVMHFHALYARILLDLAVRDLQRRSARA
ncbi:hypothetical protein DFH07DRAFT_963160 [Mycena maculata]|uniref:Uncharacterized protein n=1 Tax=Mycena maculata TaxID=230809 RepID=A0AAD7N4R0_9AGAR|nr:hypothetical protein DFH07DRAFT_963160 [Mycena maculata]